MIECEDDLLWRLRHPLMVHDWTGEVQLEKDATEADLCNAAKEIARLTTERDAARAAAIEECAQVLDKAAQDWSRIRDPGMASNARHYAKKIRALSLTPTPLDSSALPDVDGGGRDV